MWDFQKYENNKAVIDEYGNDLTYSDLICEADSFRSNIGKRALLFLLCDNDIGSFIAYVSCLENGIVPAMLNADLNISLLVKLIEVYKPEYIWCPDRRTDEFGEGNVLYSKYGYNLIETDVNNCDELYDELALLLTTSGSTGSPKFVRQSYKNVESNAKAIANYLNLNQKERPITTLPMNYTYGLSIINSHLMVGATILLTNRSLMEREFWKLFKEKEATSFGGVPYTYEMLDRLRFERMDLSALKTMTQAGGKLSTELHKKFATYAKENGINFVVMYGQCEATARMGYLPPDKSLDKIGSMGIAIPGGEFSLRDVDGSEIERDDIVGELVYKGDNVTLGYATNREDLMLGDIFGGILLTGDMAKRDKEGYYYIVGRKKRFLKIYGNRVNLDDLELLLRERIKDTELVCTGVDDHLYIFAAHGNSIQDEVEIEEFEKRVKHLVSDYTGINSAAFNVVLTDNIPRSDSGKIKYELLLKRIAE